MKIGTKTQREKEDLALEELFDEAAPDGEYWVNLADTLAKDPEHAPDGESRAAFLDRLGEEVRRVQAQKRKEAKEQAARENRLRWLRRAAVAAVFLAFAGSVVLYGTVDAFAAGVDRFITSVMPRRQEMRIVDTVRGDLDLDMADFEGLYFPNWIPEGFNVVGTEIYSNLKTVLYENSEHELIRFQICADTHSLYIDDEDVVEEKIYLDGIWGRKIYTDKVIYIVWEREGNSYCLSGSKEMEEELIKMIEESLKILKED